MNRSAQILADVLRGMLDIDAAVDHLESSSIRTEGALLALRALRALCQEKALDFCGHLRQCMSYFATGFDITKELHSLLFKQKNLFGFIFETHEGHRVNIHSEILPEVDDLRSVYLHEYRRVANPSTGDGRLYRCFGYDTYTSLAQKMLIYLIENMEENETLMACLPTGGGKSVSWQLPALSGSYRGLIIVVVPTIALAMDHERSAKALYEGVLNADLLPMAYYANVTPLRRREILDGIASGSLPILYISPEALQSGDFRDEILAAAEAGKVGGLFVDEAHLIVNWGGHFRPEFQMLASFRNKLREKSLLGLKTVLLSATYTQEDVRVIRKLYGDGIFTEFRADELRPEPSFYHHRCVDIKERVTLVQKLISQSPKPSIVYAVNPQEGERYHQALKDLGYRNIALFTGDTSSGERAQIIKEWNRDRLDVVVATSAFGMGVDKSDVRTVITAYLPESISRFYQEVGRAGRDGFASLNYFLPLPKLDREFVNQLTKSAVITIEKLADRWKSLLDESVHQTPDTVWIDAYAAPEHLRHSYTGERNAGWNKDVVLMLYRAGLIDIMEVQSKGERNYKLLVKLKNIEVLEDTERLSQEIKEFREGERERIRSAAQLVERLMEAPDHNCYAHLLTEEFPYAECVCNGCPNCRKSDRGRYHTSASIYIDSTKEAIVHPFPDIGGDLLSRLLHSSSSLLFVVEKTISDNMLVDNIFNMIKTGVNLVITPVLSDRPALMEKLSYYEPFNYLILDEAEIGRLDLRWLGGTCALIYTDDDEYNQRLFSLAKKYLHSNPQNKVVHISCRDQYIRSEGRPLSEIVDQSVVDELMLT